MNYIELLKSHEVVKKLSILQLIAYMGAWFSNVAIYTMVVEFGSTAFAISVVTAMHFIPAIIIAPLSGTIIDSFKIKPLMITLLSIELIMTLLFLTIDSKDELWLLLIFIFIRMSSASMFFSTEMTLMPKIVSGIALKKTNEIHSIIWSLTFALGMGISGVIVNYYGVKTAIIIDAILFICAILYLFRIDFKIEEIHIKQRAISMIVDGFNYLKQNRLIVHLLILHASVGLTAFDTLVTLLAKNEYKYIISVPLAIGITNAIRALALMIGPFIISNWINKDRLLYVLVLQGLTVILWGMLQYNFYLSLIAVFMTGFFITTIWSLTYAFIQEKVEHKYLGRVVSYNDMLFMLANVLTTFFIGIMADIIPLKFITMLIGFAFIVYAYYYSKIKNLI